MTDSTRILGGVLIALITLAAPSARADWTLWADGSNGVVAGTSPLLAISNQREIFYTYLAPQMDGDGVLYRASLDDPAPQFTQFPAFPLPTPPQNVNYNNVGALTSNARGEPIVGISTSGAWNNTSPMLMTWDQDTSTWIAAAITPKGESCAHNMYKLALAPNGDVWATCQWHGAYHSTDDGRSFEYIDVSARVAAAVPSYIPTRANGAPDLGALYGLAIGADGSIYIGSESGGMVYSSDGGETFRPLDADPTNLMSTMARATNMGNIGGVGVTPDGRVIAQGADGNAAYPPPGAVGLYIFDLAAQTTTVGAGFPDYVLAGLTSGQIVTTPSGVMFMHTGHDRVDKMTGDPAFGGIVRSTDGVNWTLNNAGIGEIFQIPNMNTWIDGNGRADAHPFAFDGEDIYTVTTSGKIFMQSLGAGGGTDTGTDAGTGSDTSSGPGSSGTPDTSSGGGPTDPGSSGSGPTSDTPTDAGPGDSTGAGSTSGGLDQDAGGCSCRGGDAPAPTLLGLTTLLVLQTRRRRGPGRSADLRSV